MADLFIGLAWKRREQGDVWKHPGRPCGCERHSNWPLPLLRQPGSFLHWVRSCSYALAIVAPPQVVCPLAGEGYNEPFTHPEMWMREKSSSPHCRHCHLVLALVIISVSIYADSGSDWNALPHIRRDRDQSQNIHRSIFPLSDQSRPLRARREHLRRCRFTRRSGCCVSCGC